jgi:hypothetical protein
MLARCTPLTGILCYTTHSLFLFFHMVSGSSLFVCQSILYAINVDPTPYYRTASEIPGPKFELRTTRVIALARKRIRNDYHTNKVNEHLQGLALPVRFSSASASLVLFVAFFTDCMKYVKFFTTSSTGQFICNTCKLQSTPNNELKCTFPRGVRIVPCLSPFHSSVPFIRFMKPAKSSVTVPRRSEGMRPRGPRRRPRRGVMARRREGVHTKVVALRRPLTTCTST